MQQSKKGFTLIELLVVIAIIGILSAIGLVSLNGAREKARDAQRKSDLAQMNTALAIFYDDNASIYPAQLNAVAATNGDCINNTGATIDATVQPVYAAGAASANNLWSDTGAMITEYVSRKLQPPVGGSGWQTVYCYDTNEAAASARSSYVLWAGLEGAGGTTFFSLKQNGTTATALPAACTAQAVCP